MDVDGAEARAGKTAGREARNSGYKSLGDLKMIENMLLIAAFFFEHMTMSTMFTYLPHVV